VHQRRFRKTVIENPEGNVEDLSAQKAYGSREALSAVRGAWRGGALGAGGARAAARALGAGRGRLRWALGAGRGRLPRKSTGSWSITRNSYGKVTPTPRFAAFWAFRVARDSGWVTKALTA
jgi:hypothetical protein